MESCRVCFFSVFLILFNIIFIRLHLFLGKFKKMFILKYKSHRKLSFKILNHSRKKFVISQIYSSLTSFGLAKCFLLWTGSSLLCLSFLYLFYYLLVCKKDTKNTKDTKDTKEDTKNCVLITPKTWCIPSASLIVIFKHLLKKSKRF